MRCNQHSKCSRAAWLALITLTAATAITTIAGGPREQAATLLAATRPDGDPIAALLASLTVLAQALALYATLILGLRAAAQLPGTAGRLATATSHLVATPAAHRCLDALLGASRE